MTSATYFIILFIFLLLFSIFSIIYFYISNKKYRNLKEENGILIENITNIQSNNPNMKMDERLHYTKELLDFIDTLIFDELVNQKRFDIFTKKHSKNLDFDTVIKDVSTNVFESLKSDIFLDPNVIITQNSLMRYIQKKTFIYYFSYIEQNVSSEL